MNPDSTPRPVYKWEYAHDWLKDAVNNGRITTSELLEFIGSVADSDQIQDRWQSLMDDDGYFDNLAEPDTDDNDDDDSDPD